MRYLIIFFSIVLYASIGNIKELKGNVEILRNNNVIKATLNMGVETNDTVFTHEDSKAKIVFKDNTIITIGKNSTFKISEYLYGSKPKAKFNFLKGTFVSVTGKIGKIAPKRFKLQTKNASIGIRGTIVFGQIFYGGDVVGCSSGLISVAKGGKSVLVKPGEMVGVFGDTITSPLKASYGYLKSIFSSLKLSPADIKNFFPHFSNENNQSKVAVQNTEMNVTKTPKQLPELTWKDYKIDKRIPSLHKTFEPINFDNKLLFENLKFK